MTIYDDEIDLRPYLQAILNNWWKIGLLAFVFAAIVFGFTFFLQADAYQATATILIPQSQLQLSLAEQFPTVINTGDSRSRMQAYLIIASSDAIAQQTYQVLTDDLPEDFPAYMLQEIVEISNEGDAILVTATASTPQLAAEMANQWAQHTVQAINLAYSGEQPLEVIQQQIETAETTYQAAQTELETFIETNKITEIETALQLAERTLGSYLDDKAWQITYQYQWKQHFTQISDQANILKLQLENGNASEAGNLGDAVAVMNMRENAFSSNNIIDYENASKGNNYIIQITDPSILLDTSSNYARDIDKVIKLADQEYQNLIESLDNTVTSSYLDIDPVYTSLSSDIQNLRAQSEDLTARQRELASERDLAWETYQVLLEKETEIQTNAQTNAVVTFASPAIPPEQPVAKQTVMKTAIAGVLGGMIGVMWVVIRMWWQSNRTEENHDTEAPQT